MAQPPEKRNGFEEMDDLVLGRTILRAVFGHHEDQIQTSGEAFVEKMRDACFHFPPLIIFLLSFKLWVWSH